MMHQPQIATGGGPGALSRPSSAAYPPGTHWQATNPFQPPSPLPRPGTSARSGDLSPDEAAAWSSMARGKAVAPSSSFNPVNPNVPQGPEYSYMLAGPGNSSARPPNPPMSYQTMPDDPRQQMRQMGDQMPMNQTSISQQYTALGQKSFMPQSQQ